MKQPVKITLLGHKIKKQIFTMSDAWEEIQAVKSKRKSFREKLEKRKKERQSILSSSLVSGEKSDASPNKDRSLGSPASKSEGK